MVLRVECGAFSIMVVIGECVGVAAMLLTVEFEALVEWY
jgi:hypothetical protein